MRKVYQNISLKVWKYKSWRLKADNHKISFTLLRLAWPPCSAEILCKSLSKHRQYWDEYPMLTHSVLRVILTPKISNSMETLIFSSGWIVAGNHPLSSILSNSIHLSNDFFQIQFWSLISTRKPAKTKNYIYENNVNMGGANWTKLSTVG